MFTLHVYAQEMWHDPAYIAGTPEALQSLRDAIDTALLTGRGQTEYSICTGESYVIKVVSATEEQMNQMMDPYTGSIAQNGPKFGFGPWTMLYIDDMQYSQE